jgi:YD repeat-containing protein
MIPGLGGCPGEITTKTLIVSNCNLPCVDCIGSFAPEAGSYVLSAWVKEDTKNQNVLTYLNPQIYIDFPSTNNPSGPFSAQSVGPFTAEGSIIDGWQRIEKTFDIPPGMTYINLRLQCASGDCFFDDIRIFPKIGSMKSYVYDPLNLRLVAELDERNYATLYEYDEEGKLIRVKKETERGIMTIKENKDNTKKKQ